jgi:ATP-dependent Lhr-like helicase
VDIGDLDRIIQVGTPRTVASFLQRLGRTGRRVGGLRNTLLLATSDDELMQAAGLLLLWSEGYVEPAMPPPSPRHVQAQQLLALCLQEGQVGENTWPEWLDGLGLATPDESRKIASWLVATGHLDRDNGMLFVGPEAERAFGRHHFLDLVSVFTSAPELTVLAGSSPIGTIDPTVLASKIDGPRVLALAGHSWLVRHVDWRQRKVWVELSDIRGASRWTGAPQPWSNALTDAVRRFLQGTDPGNVRLSKRATARLAALRYEYAATVDDRGTTITADAQAGARWWTWAGGRANALLAAALNAVSPGLIDEMDRYDNRYVRLSAQHGPTALRDALVKVHDRFGNPLSDVPYEISGAALDGLKFAELLPSDLAKQTLAERTLDHGVSGDVVQRPLATST